MKKRMRVAGGELRGRRLVGPTDEDARPTTERVREAVFSILAAVEGAGALDLFCGSGALGIEALSRGAARATLVDTDVGAAERNVEELGLGGRTEVVRADALQYLDGCEQDFDLIFCDPPYRLADRLGPQLDPLIRSSLAKGGRVVAESSPGAPLELSLPLITERRYGDTLIRVHGEGGGDE